MEISSFGYRTGGPPSDASLIIDCRGIQNPHWRQESDEEKRARVLRDPRAEELVIRGLQHMENGGTHVAYGCQFGRHRSYAIARELRRRIHGDSSVREQGLG